MGAGLYIHIPFCRKKCPYCDFYSIPYSISLSEKYVDTLCGEARKINRENREIDTVYIGGGTPSILSLSSMEVLLRSIKNILKSSEENTIEVNPESINRRKLLLLRRYNINRISIGVQSLYDDKLKFLGRIHSAEDAKRAVSNAKECGFSNVSIDLVYCLPYEDISSWKEELGQAVQMPIQHISCYSLIPEPHTEFYKLRRAINEGVAAEMYLFNMQFLPKAGFYQYEVSNFSLPGFECKHNIKYWEGLDYIGIGPSAVSFIGRKRTENVRDVQGYIDRYYTHKSRVVHTEKLPRIKYARELAALKIRTKQGIYFKWFKERTGFDFFDIEDENSVYSLKEKGVLKMRREKNINVGIYLTRKGFLFCDEVSSCFV